MPKIHIFDGAMGTMLQAGGLEPGACPELLNIQRPELVQRVHAEYLAAGADYIETNTFGGSPLKLAHYGLAEQAAELNRAGVACAKAAIRAAGLTARVAGSLGPTGSFIEPLGNLNFEEAYQNYLAQARALGEGGADALIIETCIDLQEMRAALLACREAAPGLPVICQLSYSEDGRTVTGTDPRSAAILLEAMGASVIGVNCSLGPQELVPVVRELAGSCSCPISVQPNAGLPYLEDGVTKFPMGPEDFGAWGPKLAAVGATYIGGCCGTTPEHIRALAAALRDFPVPPREQHPRKLWLTSRSKSVCLDREGPTVLIGERINPTGRKKLAAEIRTGSFLSVKKEALGQARAGAKVLDVNMGVGGIDQAAAMKRAVTEIAQLTDAPLAIDTSDPAALEAGLRAYPGRALVNSVSAEQERLDKFLPLAKKYGAAILCLPLTDGGLPKTVEERLQHVQTIMDRARAAGLREGDFLVDALVLTVSSDASAGPAVLETLRRVTGELHLPTTMGLSNISFGLPDRPLLNSTFFAMALSAGLTAPIMNPYDEKMQQALHASAALLGKDPRGLNYAKAASSEIMPQAAPGEKQNLPILTALKQAVINGEKDEITELVDKALAEGKGADTITSQALTAAMTDIGEDFGAGRMFLPQVLLSAETMRVAFDHLQEKIPEVAADKKGTVVLATVKGDVHDLGKNIVGALLSNSGFRLIDLGKDVEAEAIVRAAIQHDADIVGLCALMTTTMVQIDNVIEALHKAGSRAKVMVGGAAVTQEYADQAGADAYAADGVQAVKLAQQMVEQ